MSHEEFKLIRMLLHHFKDVVPLPWQDWMEGFLEDLARSRGNVSTAIGLCKVSRDTVYKYRRRNQEFAERWAAITGAARGDEATGARRGPERPANQAEPTAAGAVVRSSIGPSPRPDP